MTTWSRNLARLSTAIAAVVAMASVATSGSVASHPDGSAVEFRSIDHCGAACFDAALDYEGTVNEQVAFYMGCMDSCTRYH